jgi:CO/xanthine dehydrogenase Mo-binding subunit
VKLASQAALELTETGRAHPGGPAPRIGQGTRTMHAQIVADTLGIPYDRVEVGAGGPRRWFPTAADGGVAHLHDRAARSSSVAPKRLKAKAGPPHAAPSTCGRTAPLVIMKSYQKPAEIIWDETCYQGDAYGAFAWACNVVELEVDPVTFEVRPLRLTAVAEIGKAIHPLLAAGQIEGGSAQGLGWALGEEVVMKEGRMANAQLTNYLIPTTLDTPPLDVVILERPYRHGPFGAKGVGELPIDGPAAAVANALRHAGFDVRSLPATPERLMSARAVG